MACICQWNRLTDLREDAVNCPEELEEALKRQRRIRIFSYAGGTTAIVLALATDPTWTVAAVVAAGAAIGFFYSTSPWPGRAALRIKNLFILKNLMSGVGWTLGLLIYPALRAGHSPDGPFWLASAYMFRPSWRTRSSGTCGTRRETGRPVCRLCPSWPAWA